MDTVGEEAAIVNGGESCQRHQETERESHMHLINEQMLGEVYKAL